ncbi:small nuclear ribonucleoprotein [Halobacillus sp. K22]|uniref:small nuclear ribonucleoprotein n=1 Tax=Halobacillus sp. K22 TaxID=3457431 RepID=UPI003FCD16EF
MADEKNMYQQAASHMKPTYSQCEKHKYYHVMVTLEDGNTVDGIIIDVKNDKITLLISEDVMVDENGESLSSNDRQFGYGGYGRRRARRFRRSVLPIAGLTALALFPYFTPYPYYQYPYYY